METITFYLKQHTPLIDFQHYQEGSTLRASAVKPQLDRFLIDLMGGRKTASDNGWLAQTDNPNSTALNYRMTIVPTGKRDLGISKMNLNRFPNFFGNMRVNPNDNEKYKRFTFYPDPLEVTLTFPSVDGPSLAEFIRTEHREALARFFFRTNFGTRASKGFGSFYINSNGSFYVSPSELNTDGYSFAINSEDELYDEIDGNRYNVLFRVIELFYKALRGGIVEYGRNSYKFESLAHRYCQDKLHAVWDKQGIKKELFGRSQANRNGYCDIKDTMGFSTNEFWRHQGANVSKKIRGQGGDLPTRMQSPLLFKPFKANKAFTVYLVFKEKEVQLDTFLSYHTVRASRNHSNKYVDLTLPRPFQLQDFFDYVLGLSQYVEDQYENHPYTAILTHVFNQLKDITD
ncbi:MAG TPA: hypothetical protein H9924_04640 [Candidatus Phocaeicola merdavium]|nr:hypothetical protein [Candidatus Phocaeicola merdavium]